MINIHTFFTKKVNYVLPVWAENLTVVYQIVETHPNKFYPGGLVRAQQPIGKLIFFFENWVTHFLSKMYATHHKKV